jgi:hypothetical protein
MSPRERLDRLATNITRVRGQEPDSSGLAAALDLILAEVAMVLRDLGPDRHHDPYGDAYRERMRVLYGDDAT